MAVAPAIGGDEIGVGICGDRILVQILHVRMGRRAVEVKIFFFNVFSMVAFGICKAEETFLQDGVVTVP